MSPSPLDDATSTLEIVGEGAEHRRNERRPPKTDEEGGIARSAGALCRRLDLDGACHRLRRSGIARERLDQSLGREELSEISGVGQLLREPRCPAYVLQRHRQVDEHAHERDAQPCLGVSPGRPCIPGLVDRAPVERGGHT